MKNFKPKQKNELMTDLTILLFDFKRTEVKGKRAEIKLINENAEQIFKIFENNLIYFAKSNKINN